MSKSFQSCQEIVKKRSCQKIVKNYETDNIGNIGKKAQLAKLPQKNVTFCLFFYYINK
jgi:hypothetical protein